MEEQHAGFLALERERLVLQRKLRQVEELLALANKHPYVDRRDNLTPMTFKEVLDTYNVTRGRLSQLTKGYKDSRTKKRVEPKLTYGKHWVRKNMTIEASDRQMEMVVQVLTEEGQKVVEEILTKKKES